MWTDDEIARHYKGAKDPCAMIKIIAQLNDVPEGRIREALCRAGIEPARKKTICRDTHVRVRLVSADGREITVPEAARINECPEKRVYYAIHKSDRYVVGGAPYRVVRYKRRG